MKKKGFTFAELLIVVAIIAVLVAVSIPIFTSKLHESKVAADWANVRSYFSFLQYDYQESGEIKNEYLHDDYRNPITSFDLYGQTIKLETGYILIRTDGTKGYNILYMCNKAHDDCQLVLPLD